MCLQWLDTHPLTGLQLLDYGCGSGILGIAALLLGATKVHGIDNLYIAGSSVYPTGGAVNPTFTLVAMSLRLADHLAGLA